MKDYFKSLNKSYPIIRILKFSVIAATVALMLDTKDIPSTYIKSHDLKLVFILLGAALLLAILFSLEIKILEMFKIITINFLDESAVILLCSILLYTGVSLILVQLSLYKILAIIIAISFSILILVIRANRFKKQIKVSDEYKTNIIDLRDLFYGDFRIEENKIVLVNEKDVDYDLLERKGIINQLINAINKSNPDGRFVISLEGRWGSGKTTIINNVKKKLIDSDPDIVVIDEFDPWTYSNQESLLYNMFDIILKKTGIKYSELSMKQIINNVNETILGYQKNNGMKGLFKVFSGHPNEITALRNKINDYLKLCGRKIVFFIDNIDRADSKNIILLFKLVGNVFDFERVTYVLSFDDEQVKKAFDNDLNIDYQYLKKVINMQIRVHEINRNVLENVFEKCMSNLFLSYGETAENLNFYRPIVDCVCQQTKDIRDFKRFINSVISTTFSENTYLNKRELLAIEYMRLHNFTLYQSIYQNRKFFISHDKMADREIYYTAIDKKEFNSQAKSYFDELFSDKNNGGYINLLAEIFPYVKKYKSGQELEYEGYYGSDNQYADIVKKQRMCSAKYFDLYFTYTENDYLFVDKLISGFVDSINQSTSIDDIESVFNTKILTVHPSFQKEIFERLQFYIEDLRKDALFDMVCILFDNINDLDNASLFLVNNARERVEIIIWEVLQRITEEHYDKFLEIIAKRYGNIMTISRIFHWFEKDREGKAVAGRKQKWQDLYRKLGDEILKESINLYDDKYYLRKNIWELARLYKDDRDSIRKYISKVINQKTIFRFIYDIVGLAIGTKYTYSISKENLESLTSEEDIDKILVNVLPRSNDEQFVLDVYESYKNGEVDAWGEGGIVTDCEKKLTL